MEGRIIDLNKFSIKEGGFKNMQLNGSGVINTQNGTIFKG